MPWQKDRAARQADAATYGSAEYRRNRATIIKAAHGYCAQCAHKHNRLQCDHIVPVSKGGTHALTNLRAICSGPGTCRCHEAKTAQEGRGYRQPKGKPDPEPKPRTQW